MPFAVAGVVSAGVGLYTSSQQSKAVRKGQQEANELGQQSLEQQQAAQEQLRADLQPYSQAGLPALGQTNALLGLSGPDAANAAMANFRQNPGYQFQMDQGLRAIDSGAAARGMLRSGATMQAEQTFGANLANQSFNDYYNKLMGMTTLGQNAAAGVGASGVQSANSQANVLGNMAQTATSGASSLAGIYGNAGAGVSNALNQGAMNYAYSQGVGGPAGGTTYGGTPAQNKLMGGFGGSKYPAAGGVF